MNKTLRLVLDFAPLGVFFVAYRLAGLLPATAALIAATLLALSVIYAREKRIAPIPLASAVLVTIFGGLTLWLADETFIKMKPTIINLLFSTILLVGLSFGRPLLKYLLAEAMQLTEVGWHKLSLRWGLFFLFLAGLNELIWRSFPTEFWVDFKVFGMFTLTILFSLSQVPLIQREWTGEKS